MPLNPDGSVGGSGDDALVYSHDYLPSDREAEHLTRDLSGLPLLRLVPAGDRLVVWSPLNGGALINPRGSGLRRMGLIATYARGITFSRARVP